jgi:3-phosphoglycerate kinase
VFVLGVFEMDAFAKGTYGVAATLAELTGKGCITIIGGGGETQYITFFPNHSIPHHFCPFFSSPLLSFLHQSTLILTIPLFSSLITQLFLHHSDSVAAVEKAGLADKMSHISTGTYA